MIEIFKISLAVFALWYCFQEGEIFGFTQKIKLWKMADPLRDCPVCMVPYWGSLVYWIWIGGSLGDYTITIVCSLGLNAVVVHLFPDKETPGIHQQLTDIDQSLIKIGQAIKPITQEIHEKQLKEKNGPISKRAGR